jgi:pimeloyl-ACP methyl ester carboxylesterase
MSQLFPQVLNRSIMDCGHFAHLEAPEQVNHTIQTFLDDLPVASEPQG